MYIYIDLIYEFMRKKTKKKTKKKKQQQQTNGGTFEDQKIDINLDNDTLLN